MTKERRCDNCGRVVARDEPMLPGFRWAGEICARCHEENYGWKATVDALDEYYPNDDATDPGMPKR